MPKGVYIRSEQEKQRCRILFLGHKHTSEAKIKMATKLKGRSQTEEHRRKRGLAIKGKKNGCWKGGITSKNQHERDQFHIWIQKRVLERDNYTCQICNKHGNDVLHVDHIQSWSEYIEGRFSLDNLRTLCVGCHYYVTYGKKIPENSKWGKGRVGYQNR